MQKRGWSGVRALWTGTLFLLGGTVRAAEGDVAHVVEVGPPVTPLVWNGSLMSLPEPQDWRPGDPVRVVPKRTYPRDGEAQGPEFQGIDPLIQLQSEARTDAPGAFTTPIVNVNGLGFNGVFPPDPNGDVGPSHFIETINSGGGTAVRILDKNGATVKNFTLSSLATSGACTSGFGDPIVLYDPLADRWLLSEFAGSGNNLCVYISQSSDPVNGGWFAYRFSTPTFPDYPKYAVWPDGYYVTTNENSPTIYALDRVKMLQGLPATSQRFTVPSMGDFGFQTVTPADFDGVTPPASGANAYVARHRDDENNGPSPTASDFIDIWGIHVDWTTPSNSTITQLPGIATSEFDSNMCGLTSFSCIPEPGTGTRLDPLREVIMHRFAYRNFGSYESLVGVFVTDVGDFADHGGVRWVELRRTGGNWSLFQEGTYSPNSVHRWMAGIAQDQSGDIAIAYSVSDATSVNPGLRYTGRLSTDAPGTMSQPETTIVSGGGSQTIDRWGDYASMSVDPADQCTFWFAGEYCPSSNWGTRVASFKFDQCGGSTSSGVDYVLGEGLGATNHNGVVVRNSSGGATGTSFQAYGANAWGTNVSSGNIDGGGTWEILSGPGPGAVFGPQVRAFVAAGTAIAKVNFFAYGTLKYGVNVASCNMDADAFREIVSGAGPGGVFGPHVRGWNYDNASITPKSGVSYFAYATLKYGVNVGAGDVDGDNFEEILTGAGPSGAFGSAVRGWDVDGGSVASIGAINFAAFSFQGFGCNVAGGDADGDGFAEIGVTPGPGPSHPSAVRGLDYDNVAITQAPGFTGTFFTTFFGARVGFADLDDDASDNLLLGPGRDPAATPTVKTYDYSGSALAAHGAPFSVFSGDFYGVNVAGGTLGL